MKILGIFVAVIIGLMAIGAIGKAIGVIHDDKQQPANAAAEAAVDAGPVTIQQERGRSYSDAAFIALLDKEAQKHSTNFGTMCTEILSGGMTLINPGIRSQPAKSSAELLSRLDFRSRDFSVLGTVIGDIFGFPAEDISDAFYGNASNQHALDLTTAKCRGG